jgi:hypothetical protein
VYNTYAWVRGPKPKRPVPGAWIDARVVIPVPWRHVPIQASTDTARRLSKRKHSKKIRQELNCGPLATVPELYHFDEQAHIIIMEDCGVQPLNLKQLMLTATPLRPSHAKSALCVGPILRPAAFVGC